MFGGVMSGQIQMSFGYSPFVGGGFGLSSQFSPVMMQRLMQMQMMMGAMIGMQGGMMMPMMQSGMMGGGMQIGGMGMMAGAGSMSMFGAMGQMGGANMYGMSSYGNVGMFGGTMMGQSMSGIMGGGFGGFGMGMMGETTATGAVGMFGFRNRVEKDPFGTGGGGMGGDRNANLANSPETVLALDSILKSHKNQGIPMEQVQKELKEKYGMEANIETVDGKKTLKFANGDFISDANGNSLLDRSEYGFSDSLKQIKEKYGMDSSTFDLMYNKTLTPEQRQNTIQDIIKSREAEYSQNLKKSGYNSNQINYMTRMNRMFGATYGLTPQQMIGSSNLGITPQWGANTPESKFYGPQFLGGAFFNMGSMFGGYGGGMGMGNMLGMYTPMFGMFANAHAFGR